jgi:hypothetical protein
MRGRCGAGKRTRGEECQQRAEHELVVPERRQLPQPREPLGASGADTFLTLIVGGEKEVHNCTGEQSWSSRELVNRAGYDRIAVAQRAQKKRFDFRDENWGCCRGNPRTSRERFCS